MATRRRDTAPRKDKTEASSSHTPDNTLHLKPTPNVISSPQNNGPTAPIKTTPKASLRPATRSSTGFKKSTPPNTTHSKPTTTTRRTLDKSQLPTRVIASPSTRPRDKTPLRAQNARVSTTPSFRPHDKTPPPAHKKHVSTISSLRPRDKTPLPAQTTHVSTPQASSFPKKSTASQKVGSGKNRKPLNKDVGKHSTSSHATPVNATLKTSNICIQEELETEKIPTSAAKEQTTESFQETFENTDIYENLPEVDTLLEDQESFTFETVEQIIQVVSDDERDSVGLVPKDQEKPVDIAQTKAENDHKEEGEAKIVTIEPSPVVEQQEAPIDIKTQESEDKPCIEEKLEEVVHDIHITDNIVPRVADELPKEEGKEKEVEEVVVVVEKEEGEKEKALDKKDEVASQSEAIEPVETKVQEIVEKQKPEPEHKAQKQQGWPRVKKDVVSNDTIEETASKLRDQRRNRVRALAGAFESVISSQ
ncbi:hypothetical protein CASFOL_036640 [Castilleja foliolosa]|uniref:Calmodulin-binding domain-containing protein n=1 Tax=Castilleja foliolosa TaxID=1961234 RepID=A0ABD3BNQ9_9LAMI